MRFISTTLLSLFLISLTYPVLADTALPAITSFSTDFISVTANTPYQTTIAIYGTDLGYLLDSGVVVTLGPLTATSVAGNSTGMNLTFTVDTSVMTESLGDYPIVVTDNGITLLTTTNTITIYNPYQLTPTPSHPKQLLNSTAHPHRRTKQTVGLNVHWTMGSDTTMDDLYTSRLDTSHTGWAREQFSYKLLTGPAAAGWMKRYDQIMLNYQAQGIHVVGMLAYGDANNEFVPPATADWENFVANTVQRYGNYVDAWELWNEPDSPTYLQPRQNWKTYRPLLKYGSAMVRQYDPSAIVLNGAVSDITNQRYIKQLYTHGKQYFDELNVHLYYCGHYRDANQQLTSLQTDWNNLEQWVQQYRHDEKIWVTELGCSTGLAGVNNKLVKNYYKQSTKFLLSYDNLRPILLYTIRDRTYLTDPYEAFFGLLHDDGSIKPAWRWYKLLANS